MDQQKQAAVLRIGELSRRVGVSEHVLRAWESRYGLLKPERSEGGYRLYSADDQRRVRRMLAHLGDGLAAAQAARAALRDEEPPRTFDGTSDGSANGSANGSAAQASFAQAHAATDALDPAPQAHLVDSASALAQALDELDEQRAQTVLDRLLSDFTMETVLRDVLMPYLHEVGERWADGEVSVGQEHFASHVVRGRLEGVARGWGSGPGPLALLACPPGELHDLALLAFGIVLNRRGWRIAYLGVNTPMLDTISMTSNLRPALIVLAATIPERFAEIVPELRALVEVAPLFLAGAGATPELARRLGAGLLNGDPVTAAVELAGATR